MWTVPFQDNWLTVCTVELERTFIVNVNDTYIDYTFFHHHQGSIDLNTVNIHHTLRMYLCLIHPSRDGLVMREWLSVHCLKSGCTLGCTMCLKISFRSQSISWYLGMYCVGYWYYVGWLVWFGPLWWHLCSWQQRCPCILLSSSSLLCTHPGSTWFSLMKWQLSLKKTLWNFFPLLRTLHKTSPGTT